MLDNDDSFTHNLAQIIKNCTEYPLYILSHSDFNIISLNQYKAILFSPGPELPNNRPKMFEILEKSQGKIPILGICLGHQAIGQYCGAELKHLGKVRHGFTASIKSAFAFDTKINNFKAGLYHSWVIETKNFPKQLEITAKDSEGNIMAIKHKIFPWYGFQFHPESYITIQGEALIQSWFDFINKQSAIKI